MSELERYINDNTSPAAFDPLVRCCLVHYQFEAIHPFADGNGRVGRALLALMIYKALGHSKPWLYLSAFFEKHRDEYIDRLFSVSTKGDWTGWVELCLRAVISQADDSVRRCHLFNKLREDYRGRVSQHSSRTWQIIESLFSAPFVTVPRIAKRFSVEYPTAKSDILKLVDAKILHPIEKTRPMTFVAPEVMQIAYDDIVGDDTQSPTDDAESVIEGSDSN